jgi:hypothetical protein
MRKSRRSGTADSLAGVHSAPEHRFLPALLWICSPISTGMNLPSERFNPTPPDHGNQRATAPGGNPSFRIDQLVFSSFEH